MNNSRMRSRGGFTLPEVLVAVAMVGVLSAVVLPTVIGQIGKGEVSRVVQDLQSVEQAAQMFRSDVGKWPASIAHLVDGTLVTSGTASLDATNYGTGAASWNGPYLARGSALTLPTAMGGVITGFTSVSWGGNNFVAITATGLGDNTETADIDEAIDSPGDGTSLVDDTDGKIRFSSPTLYYLTSPRK